MTQSKRVDADVPKAWELGGESTIHCEVKPDPLLQGEDCCVRLTHSNTYGPVDDVEFFVRVGQLENPTKFEDTDSATDWTAMQLIEEVVWIDGEERYRSEVENSIDVEEGTVWAGTFEAVLVFPVGEHRIEIKVVSNGHLQSGVISDWRVKVQ